MAAGFIRDRTIVPVANEQQIAVECRLIMAEIHKPATDAYFLRSQRHYDLAQMLVGFHVLECLADIVE
jgi:hypothetical protein